MSENAHAADEHHHDIDSHVKTYWKIFGALMVLTFITWFVSTIHMSIPAAIGLALFIATIKGSLVACYFMHLINEKKLIYVVMALTVLFFLFELTLPVITESNNINMGS